MDSWGSSRDSGESSWTDGEACATQGGKFVDSLGEVRVTQGRAHGLSGEVRAFFQS